MFAGALALVAGVFFACGGSGNSSGAASGIPTDGLLGEVPAQNVKWLAEQEQMRQEIENEENDDKRTKLKNAFSEWEKARKEKGAQLLDALKGKEVPTEVAEGVPMKFENNLKLTWSSIAAYRQSIKMQAKGVGTLTADLPDITFIPNFIFVAYDTDGNVIDAKCYALAQYKGDKDVFKADKAGDNYEVSPTIQTTTEWARLAKLVLMDKTSEAYKLLLEAQNQAE